MSLRVQSSADDRARARESCTIDSARGKCEDWKTIYMVYIMCVRNARGRSFFFVRVRARVSVVHSTSPKNPGHQNITDST